MKAKCIETILSPNRESWYDRGCIYDIYRRGDDFMVKDNDGDWHCYNRFNFKRYFELL